MRLLRVLLLVLLPISGIVWPGVHACAQTGKKVRTKDTDLKDTVIVYKTEEVEQTKPMYDPASSMRKKVTIIHPNDTIPKPRPRRIDTVIILKKGLTKEQLAERDKEKTIEVLKNNNYCSCVKMDIKAPTTLDYETYLGYDFIFKNDCKIDVFISSKHFRFTPYNTFGKPVKVLRKLSFVKRYDHPDFVKLAPGETYTFNYSDDAFFEYDLKKGQSYKFIFEHRNFGDRSKVSPEKTYLCGQQRTQLITVK